MDLNTSAADFSEYGDAVKLVQGDVTNFEDVIKAVISSKPDRIMNLAYLLGSGEDTPHFSLRVTILGMDNCFEAARLCGVDRVTYASSLGVSGLQSHFGNRMTTEDDPMFGIKQYSKHKMFNEYQASQYNQIYNMKITGIRPSMITGYDKVRGSTDHVLAIVLPAEGLPVNFPYKGITRLPLHVDEIAVRTTVETDEANQGPGDDGALAPVGELTQASAPIGPAVDREGCVLTRGHRSE